MKKNKSVFTSLVLIFILFLSSNMVIAATKPAIVANIGYPYYNTGGYNKKQPGTKNDNRSGYTGYVSSWDEPGAWVEWLVEVPEDGEYFLVIRYATGEEKGAKHDLSISQLYGEEYFGLDNLYFPLGGKWGSAEWLVKVVDKEIDLKQGKNIVRLTLLDIDEENGGMNLLNLGFIEAQNGQLNLSNEEIIQSFDELLYTVK